VSGCNRRRDDDGIVILGSDDAAAFVAELALDLHEGELVLALDWRARVCGAATRFPHDCGVAHPPVDADQLRLIAEELDAIELVLVTFVADERIAPTAADVARLEGLRVECRAHGIGIVDHLLCSGSRSRSVGRLSWAGGDHGA
jgi:hypothetical protein